MISNYGDVIFVEEFLWKEQMIVSEILDFQNGSVLLSPSRLLFFYLCLLFSRMKTVMSCLDIIRFN